MPGISGALRLRVTHSALRMLASGAPLPKGQLPRSLDGKRVLVIQYHALGDCLMTTPLLRGLKASNPGMALDVIAREFSQDVFRNNPDCDNVHVWDPKSILAVTRICRKLRRNQYDLVLNCVPAPATAMFSRAIRPKTSVGFVAQGNGGRNTVAETGSYGRDVEFDPECHIVDQLLRLGNGWIGEPPSRDLFFHDSTEARKGVREWLNEQGIGGKPFHVLHPAGKWSPKRWPAAHWSNLCRALVKDAPSSVPVLVGSKEDGPLLATIAENTGVDTRAFIGESIDRLAALLAQCRSAICNDSFVMHLAAAMHVPLVALYGPVSPSRTQPSGGNTKVLYSNEFCSPCPLYFSPDRCWRGINFCLWRIEPQQVLQAVKSVVVS